MTTPRTISIEAIRDAGLFMNALLLAQLSPRQVLDIELARVCPPYPSLVEAHRTERRRKLDRAGRAIAFDTEPHRSAPELPGGGVEPLQPERIGDRKSVV